MASGENRGGHAMVCAHDMNQFLLSTAESPSIQNHLIEAILCKAIMLPFCYVCKP